MDFSSKTVIITGAANGIGRGVALQYAMQGALFSPLTTLDNRTRL